MTNTIENRETINIVYNEGEKKPWELKFDDVSRFKHARALLNHPEHKFETEEEAIEVAGKLQKIIKADGVEVEDDTEVITTFDEIVTEPYNTR